MNHRAQHNESFREESSVPASGRILASAAALLLVALGACSVDVGLGSGNLGQGGGGTSATSSTGSGDTDCTDKPCGLPCSKLGDKGYCDGSGDCRGEWSCGPVDPCVGKTCGEPCLPCGSDDPAADCPDQGVGYACDLSGICQPEGFSCGPCDYNEPDCPYDPCLAQKLPCGAPCNPDCDPLDKVCLAAASLVCNANHECRPEVEVQCNPCVDAATQAPKLCGAECSACDATPWLACERPFAPSGVTVCDGAGACVPPEKFAACPGSPGWVACSAAVCGDGCSLCDPMDPGCAPDQQLVCNDALQCVGTTLCAFNDCNDKACGDPCSPCDYANDPFCYERANSKYCDGSLACVLDEPPGDCP